MRKADFSLRGDFVYFPEGQWKAVTRELLGRYPPGSKWWGTNRSKWKVGHWYVWGDVEIAMEEVVRSAVDDETTVEVLSIRAGLTLEGEKGGDDDSGERSVSA